MKILTVAMRMLSLISVFLLFNTVGHAATFTVTNTLDAGVGSLRQAITDANANVDADIINITATGTLTNGTTLTILNTVTINGNANFTIQMANGTIFSSNGPDNLVFNGLRLLDNVSLFNNVIGITIGGCSSLTISNCVFTSVSRGIIVSNSNNVLVNNNSFNSCGNNTNQYCAEFFNITESAGRSLDFYANTINLGGNGYSFNNVQNASFSLTGTSGIVLPNNDGKKTCTGTSLAIFNCVDVVLDGFDLSYDNGTATPTVSGTGLVTTNCNNLKVQNCQLLNRYSGISITTSDTLLLHNNNIQRTAATGTTGDGIEVSGGNNATITNNTLTQYGLGVGTYGVILSGIGFDTNLDRLDMRGNIFSVCGNAVRLRNMVGLIIHKTLIPAVTEAHLPDNDGRKTCFGTNLTIENCDNLLLDGFDLSYDNGTATPTVSGSGLWTTGCDNLKVQNCAILNRGNGITIGSSDTLLIHNNNIERTSTTGTTGDGIDVATGNNATITNNTLTQYGLAFGTYAINLSGIGFDTNMDRLDVRGNIFSGGGNAVRLASMAGLIIHKTLVSGVTELHLPDNDGRKTCFVTNMTINSCDNLVLDGFDLSYDNGTATPTVSGTGLITTNCSNLKVQNCAILNRVNGVTITNSDTLLVHNNNIQRTATTGNTGNGITVTNGNNTTITNNTLTQYGLAFGTYAINLNGIDFDTNMDRLDMRGNIFSNCAGGVQFANMNALKVDQALVVTTEAHLPDSDGRSGCSAINLRFQNCGNLNLTNFNLSYSGMSTYQGTGVVTSGCNNLSISNITVDNRNNGIDVTSSIVVSIDANTLTNINAQAISVDGGSNCTIKNNVLTNTGLFSETEASIALTSIGDDGTNRLDVTGNTFNGGNYGFYIQGMPDLIISKTYTSGTTELHFPDTDGRSLFAIANLYFLGCNNLVLNDLNFVKSGVAATGYGVRVNSSTGVTISNVNVSKYNSALRFNNITNVTLTNNTLSTGINAIYQDGFNNGFTLQDNIFNSFTGNTTNQRTLRLENVGVTANASNNKFRNCLGGFHVWSSPNLKISDGSVANTNFAIAIADSIWATISPIDFQSSSNILIDKVTIKARPGSSTPAGNGISLISCTNSTVTNSSITGRINGINIGFGNSNTVSNCLLQENTTGLATNGQSNILILNVTASNNNMLCNTSRAIFANNNSIVNAANNYWGAANGSITNGGSGDSYFASTALNNIGAVTNTTTFLTTEDPASPIGGQRVFNKLVAQLTNGQTAISVSDSTNYGSINAGQSKTRQFRILNNGLDTMYINTITSTNARFTVSNIPSYVLCMDTLSFNVTFSPLSASSVTSTIAIKNVNCKNTEFKFNVGGTGLCDISITSITPTDEVCPGANDGTLTVVAACGTCAAATDIRYSIDGTTFTNTTGIFTGLADGTYTVTVRDVVNPVCTAVNSVDGVVDAGTDTTPPMITPPAPITVSVNTACTATGVALGSATVTDNCDNTVTVTNNGLSAYPVGVSTVTWTSTDIYNNTGTAQQTVTVIAADINLQGNGININTGDNMPDLADGTNFGIQALNSTTDRTFTIQNLGTNVLNLTGTPRVSISGSSAFSVQTQPSASSIVVGGGDLSFVVRFNPTSAGPYNAMVTITNNDCDEGSYSFAVTGALDCDISITSVTPTHETCPNANDGTLTVTATCGSCGSASDIRYSRDGTTFTNTTGIFSGLLDGTYTIYVRDVNNITCTDTDGPHVINAGVDTTPPVITCPTNITVNTAVGLCTASNVTLGTATVTDNCNMSITPTNNAPTSYALGVTTITWTANDGNGNTATCTQTVTVIDNQAPTISCAANVTINNSPGICTGTTTLTPPTATDNCSNSNSMVSTNTVTYEAWIFPDGLQAAVAGIIFRRDGGTAAGLSISFPDPSKIGYSWNDNGATYLWTGGPTYVQNQWNHVALVIEPTKATIYLNGVPYVNNVANPVINLAGTTRLGDDNCCGPRHFNGSMDEVRIWSYARTQAQIQASMNAELIGNEQGLVSYYKFNQGTAGGANAGLTCLTASKGNTGTLNNFALSGSTSNWATGQIANGLAFDGVDDFVDIGTLNLNPNLLTLTNNYCSAIYPIGTTTVTWTATDANGNTATCTQTVTVIDNQAPVITCPANVSANNTPGLCSAVVTYTAPTGTDNCPGSTTTQIAGLASGATYPVGVTTNTFRVTDASGNTATCSFTVTVTDNQLPTITCPANVSANNTPGLCSAVVTYTAPTGTDNCPGSTTTQTAGLASGATYPVGVTTNTFRVTDASGNTATCSFTVTVTDNQLPTITCPANVSANNTPGLCSAIVTYTAPTGSDNCPGSTTTQIAGLASGAAYPVGVTTNTFRVTDASGNTATCSFTVTVTDNQLPTITCPANVSANNTPGLCSAVVTYTAPTGTDNCPGSTTTQTAGLASGATYPVGVTTNTFRVTDASGNTATCSFTVTVTDNQLPTITCPANVSANNTPGLCSAVVTYTAPTGTDNCPGSTTIQIAGLASGATYPVGVTTNTFRVTDASGNTATCSFTVTVTDNQLPTITCPANVSANNTPGLCSAVVTYTAPTGIDNCPGSTTTQTAGLASGATYPVGVTTNTFRVTDASGNTATCSFTVTVTDNQLPTITCPANVSANNTPGLCSAVVIYTAPTGTDNCPGSTTSQIAGLASGATYPVGVTTNTFRVTDASGNTATCSFTVTVTDNQLPTITCPANVSANNTPGLCSAIVTYTAPTGTDNCPGSTTTQIAGLASGATYPVGVTTNTFRVTDASGNTATCSFTVTVTDNQAPVNIVIADLTSTCPLTVSSPTTTDNCAGVVTGMTTDPLTYAEVGTYVVHWTFDDGNGNTIIVNQNVIINGPDADVFGNAVEIVDGDNTPSLLDHTSMGSNMVGGSITKTFTIQNNGNQPLVLSGITSDDGEFVIGTLPASPVGSGMSVTFDVTFTTLVAGLKDATINIISNSCNEQPFDFKVDAMLGCPYPDYMFTGGDANNPTDPADPDNWQYGCVPPSNDPGINITIMSGETFRATAPIMGDVINNGTFTGTANITGNFINNGIFNPGN